ncbi:MAG: pyruvate, phosphate dikinase [Planctomycetes bacterium]|nr:pyruvate, phosphate dikinase [Planctomycetota bacterium]
MKAKPVSKTRSAKKSPAAAARAAKSSRKAPTPAADRRTWAFGDGKADGKGDMKEILGGKGAGLAEMSRLGLPVPPGFTIATTVCKRFWDDGGKLPDDLWPEVEAQLARVEKALGRKFGSGPRPLLVSVRSGAASSMPGMMDTVLNVGLNDATRESLAAETGNRRFALDSHRRLIHMFARVVEEMNVREFDQALDTAKRNRGTTSDAGLTVEDLVDLVAIFREIFQARAGCPFPDDPREQLRRCVMAVFRSWNGDRAKKYRDIHKITGLLGTAVNVQAMVFGNMGDSSATGVCFTRDPETGANVFYGEFLPNAQGEDVVAGIRTPLPIAQLKKTMPKPYADLVRVKELLERHYGDVQDMEFTIQQGKLWMLQTRNGKRSPQAVLRTVVDMVDEKRITKEQAILRVDPAVIDILLHPTFDRGGSTHVLAKGLPASPGAASGRVVFDAETAEAWKKDGRKVILVRAETSPEDIGGMNAAQGILTSRGGRTSHAAVVARGMGRTCVVGCSAITIDEHAKEMFVAGSTVREGDWISIDGSTGEVMLGQVATTEAKLSKYFTRVMAMADEFRTAGVRANAETPLDARVAREFGAEGIGLCRTEHMFFDERRIVAVREMILAEDTAGRKAALAKLLPFQQKDFEEIFGAMDGLPVTVRLLDPPLHEFVPNTEKAQAEVAASLGVDADRVRRRVQQLHEMNPMMGHRGCRLGISYPEIYEMQVRAIALAVVALRKRRKDPRPEIMIPLVGHVNELRPLADMTRRVMDEVLGAAKVSVPYTVGTMIEVPRAALTADQIAAEAQFFSFGTNDLTQMTFGFSRDDVNSFLPDYLEQKVLPDDPFQSLDTEGVGQLITLAIERGRSVRKDLKVGICGEHGGDPRSVEFCCRAGMNYVSCSPYRVPVARLAAAQAAIRAAQRAHAAK